MEEAISELVTCFCRTENRNDIAEIVKAVTEREEKSSTAVAWSIALPHARVADLDSSKVCIGYSLNGIDFHSQDGTLSHLIFLILSPEADFSGHIRMLADLSGILSHSARRRRLEKAVDAQEVIAVLKGGCYGNQ